MLNFKACNNNSRVACSRIEDSFCSDGDRITWKQPKKKGLFHHGTTVTAYVNTSTKKAEVIQCLIEEEFPEVFRNAFTRGLHATPSESTDVIQLWSSLYKKRLTQAGADAKHRFKSDEGI